MNYILNIHTTAEIAIVNICNENKVLGNSINTEPKEHASFLHIAINKILQDNDIKIGTLKAIGVTAGPGSYTGIRVGLATAKGLCFALQIPMMMYNSLELMAFSAIENFPDLSKETLFCPMIDARRMEVFTAVYNRQLNEINPPSAMVLNETSFEELAKNHLLFYFGSGAEKFKKLAENQSPNLKYILSDISSTSLAKFGWNKFQKKDFENVINAKPLYVKEFYTPAKIG
ncbi:MAG: tRNA (adenosine(37)-N6)-threonylcarbamoyltransferase complex dimerization subunit type 1 TsaB [Bacteroidota bacterium]|nr:tRNA (adenosine(37)-N6)-threonylcarbamoyltransferase complex dimerization subunit type 1 TsaB [Bacteroidota bacterium]